MLILKRLFASVICILIWILLSIGILSSCNRCNAFLEDKSQGYNKIRLMTFNASYDNKFKDFENLIELILFEKPDVIQLQEVSPQMYNKLKFLQSFFPYSSELNKPIGYFDSIILSKYPLINSRVKDYHAVLISFVVDDTKLTILGVHLENQTNQTRFNNAIKGMKYLKTLVKNINQNLILMGDLNMTPVSKRFSNFLEETNLYTYISFKHPTSTWPTFLPDYLGIQVDHVLFSKNFKAIGKKTTDYFESDHRPLIVDLAL